MAVILCLCNDLPAPHHQGSEHCDGKGPVSKVDKLIVTNKRALKSKYGAGAKKIEEAWDDLVWADETRGVTTQVIALDDPAQMPNPDHAVRRATNAVQAKVAIDTVFRAYQPHYLGDPRRSRDRPAATAQESQALSG